mmetsp:Transcript_45776/g.33484  ORF Transcript_45776/g.33484 Transcript_45776/m.33484 type:complete len:80 (-) Transcript_45776:302-541(-)|eukprot:CAMPEP_0202963678 /NCGR_PEP_ID=MMETSP1396-20130829/7685_1 /ASSEMBLY_ACC=CAM_ASM_000872 /TAXON_ID= /ORGANISM="Pseudokeronopsis sp., Strain Brazil" /LENGTH=79 /DNA_ID=CAMNT_0049685099 /DNA_START=1276 /DNA_END=1515 /DNA_ORIENTATION=-
MVKAKPVLTDQGLQKEFANIEDLEMQKKALEWEENQERMKKHPEMRQKTIFMNFRRNDSIEVGGDPDVSDLHQELSLIR